MNYYTVDWINKYFKYFYLRHKIQKVQNSNLLKNINSDQNKTNSVQKNNFVSF